MLDLIKSRRIRNLIGNSGALFVSSKLQALVSFAQSIIVARGLGVKEYGKWAIVTTMCGLIMNFSTFRTSDVLGKYIVELRTKKDFSILGFLIKKSVILDFITHLMAMAFILFASLWVTVLFKGPENPMIYLIFGFSLFFQFTNATWFCLERDNSNYRTIALLDLIVAFLRLVLIIVFFLFLREVNLLFLAFSFLFSGGVFFIVKVFRINSLLNKYRQYSLKKLLFVNVYPTSKTNLIVKEYWQFMRVNYFSTFFSSAIKKMDILAVGFFYSSESVGLLRLAKHLSTFIQNLANNIVKPIYQDFNELVEIGKKSKILVFLKRNLKYYLSGLLIFLFIFSLVIEPFIKMFYGNAFLPSLEFFRIYLVLVFIVLGSFWTDPLILALKGWNFKFKMLVLSLIFLFFAVLSFRTFWGVAGILWACVMARFFIAILSTIFILKKLSLEDFINQNK